MPVLPNHHIYFVQAMLGVPEIRVNPLYCHFNLEMISPILRHQINYIQLSSCLSIITLYYIFMYNTIVYIIFFVSCVLTFLQASDGKKCLLPHWTQFVSFSQEISDYSRRFEYANMYQQLEWHVTHVYSTRIIIIIYIYYTTGWPPPVMFVGSSYIYHKP